jgi:hypothetical protein
LDKIEDKHCFEMLRVQYSAFVIMTTYAWIARSYHFTFIFYQSTLLLNALYLKGLVS